MKLAIIIGKFSPCHSGHIKSILGIKKWADANDAYVRVYSTTSSDKTKQPLSFERKMYYVKQALKNKDIDVIMEPVTNLYNTVKECAFEIKNFNDESFQGLYLFTGSDHTKEYEILLDSIERKKGPFGFEMKVMPTEGRVDGVGLSATDARNAAKNGDYETFKNMSPFTNEKLTRQMFEEYGEALRKINESSIGIFNNILQESFQDSFTLGNEVIQKLKNAHPEAQVYYIGGTARDWVRESECNDIDIACNISKEDIMEVFPDVVSANRFGAGYIVIINYKGQKFDLDSVVNSDIKEKVKTGDLTFNCMAVDPTTKEVYDPDNGIPDLESHTLRFSTYVFDLLQKGSEARSVLRPFKFMSRWGWKFDRESENAIKEFVENGFNFNRVQPNNLQKIMDAIKSGPHAELALSEINRLGVDKLLTIYEEKKGVKLLEASFRGSQEDAFETVKDMISKIKAEGNWCYIVGGAARDHVMGIESNDYDLITNMSSGYLEKVLGIPKKSKMWRNSHEVAIFVVNGEDYEISLIGRSSSLEEEMRNRDLTMNALAWDPLTDEIIDPCGGLEDIENEELRLCPGSINSVAEGNQEIRVFRLIRFYATTGFDISDDTMKALWSFAQKKNGDFGVTSIVTFRNNWNKMKKGKNFDLAVDLLKQLNLYDFLDKNFGPLK